MPINQISNIFTNSESGIQHEKLPVGNYLLKFNEQIGYHLIKKEPFKLPKKLYGDISITERWLKSWNSNTSKNLGILLTGIKGSGKTITAQKFCIDSNLPVIIIQNAHSGSNFIDFITSQSLGECIIFIDEFEKVYSNRSDNDQQNDLLSLMDGNYQTRLIFLLTTNEDTLNPYLVNRLNRIKYRKDYHNLDKSVIEAVMDDMLINKSHSQSVFDFFTKVNIVTYDLLVNLIKEMNFFGEDAIECGKHLNLRTEYKMYSIIEIVDGIEYPCNYTKCAPFNPQDTCYVVRRNTNYIDHLCHSDPEDDSDDDDDDYGSIYDKEFTVQFSDFDIISYDDHLLLKHKNSFLCFKFTERKNVSITF